MGSTLTVTGAATLSSTLAVTGASTLSCTLAVTGAASMSSTLAVTGSTTLGGLVALTSYSVPSCGGACSLDFSSSSFKSMLAFDNGNPGSSVTFSITNCVKGYMFAAVNDDSGSAITIGGYTVPAGGSRMFICKSATSVYNPNPV